ncbi:MAG: LytTR family DNA-binding domain-containing protein [Lachnospiraceae bacterium]|nr:LytTR family DNA-binding domain-containing protein [Lachnospiraceae bacterium]
MKIALVDDEQKCLDEMEGLISDFGTRNYCQMETVPFLNGEAFLEEFKDGGFSAVFMDIYMDGMDGIAAALKMRGLDNRCILVFLTSSMDFMPDAFSCHAFEYITKPFSPQRIFEVLTDILGVLPPPQKYIEVISDRKTVQIFLDEIASVITDAHYLDITLSDGEKLHCRMTMSEFMGLTDGDSRFLPVNKGITLNAEYILEFENNCCILENGAKFPIRVRDRLKIEQAARDYNFGKIRERQAHFARRPMSHGIRKGD